MRVFFRGKPRKQTIADLEEEKQRKYEEKVRDQRNKLQKEFLTHERVGRDNKYEIIQSENKVFKKLLTFNHVDLIKKTFVPS